MIRRWDRLQRAALRARTEREIEDLIEQEERLIHELGRNPAGLRDLATMVVIGFDTGFSNVRLMGPMVMYSMEVLGNAQRNVRRTHQ